jgi:hypothetical protein
MAHRYRLLVAAYGRCSPDSDQKSGHSDIAWEIADILGRYRTFPFSAELPVLRSQEMC